MHVRTFMTSVSRFRRVRVDQIAMFETWKEHPYVLLVSGEEVLIDSAAFIEFVKAALDQWTDHNGFGDDLLWEFITPSKQLRVDQIATITQFPRQSHVTLLSGTRLSIDHDRVDILNGRLNRWLDWTTTR